jgi:hypothetical protein
MAVPTLEPAASVVWVPKMEVPAAVGSVYPLAKTFMSTSRADPEGAVKATNRAEIRVIVAPEWL